MKRKIFGALLTVVLVLSFSLIPAVPVAAQTTTYGTWYLANGGTGGAAAWSTTQAHDDTYSAYIQGGTQSTVSYGQVWKPAEITLANITAISFWHYISSSSQFDHSSWPMYLEEGETYSDSTGYFTPYVTLKINNGSTDHWLISQPFVRDPNNGTWAAGWEQWQMSDNAAASGGHNPTEALWHMEDFSVDDAGTGGAGAYPAGWEYLSYWQTYYSGYDVVELKVSMGWWAISTNQTAYVDNITVTASATTYAVEPRVFIGATPYGAIDTAIDAVTTGQTITCASGTYTEDLVIDDELTLSGPNAAISPNTGTRVTEAIINGQIEITGATNNVTIQGFHFEVTPGTARINCPGGFDGDDLSILKNSFTASPATGSWVEAVGVHGNTVITGLLIDDNLFTGVRGIFVNPGLSTPGTAVIITNNVVDGDSGTPASVGISVDGVTGTISDNTISYTIDAGINVGSAVGPCDTLAITDNTVTYAGRNGGANEGAINLYSDNTNITITGNTLTSNHEGISIKDDGALGAGIAINYNNISGNTTYGINNARAQAVDAARNWWGKATGPYHATTNPGVAGYRGDTVSDDVTYAPWLYLPAATTSDTVAEIITLQVPAYANSVVLSAGWNTFSVPIGLDSQYNTWKELITLTNLNYSLAYRFDSAKQTFVGLATTSPYAIAPGEGFYIKMDTAGSIPYCYSTLFSIPSRSLWAGWDFIAGGMTTQDAHVTCASIATTGSTAGYTHIISPAENASSWFWIYNTQGTTDDFVLGEGYWVFLPIARTLGLFDLTPVAWEALP